MRSVLAVAVLWVPMVASCREEREPTSQPVESTTRSPAETEMETRAESSPPAAARVTTAPTRSDRTAGPRPEVDVTATALDIDAMKWMPGPPSLPTGAQVAVLEGSPPFPADKTFTLIAKFPKNYTIPPHTHLVTERVTVLRGVFSFGHGEKLDRKSATKVKAGGLVLIPAGHVHYAFTTDQETVISLNGVGPWEIIYVNPKDDPRPTPARKPDRPVANNWDGPTDAKILQAADITYTDPAPGMLPPGAKMAVLEGDPMQPKMYTLRLQMPKDYRIPVHSHSHTERFMLLAGAMSYATGDTWDEAASKPLAVGGVGVVPGNEQHFARVTKDGTVLQVTGVGPLDMKWANPAEVTGAAKP